MATPTTPIRIALAGNPNSGKSTLFNAMTGERVTIGNYSGVTVETAVGQCKHNHQPVELVDLPGTYSLTPYSVEEIVARNYLLDEAPDVVIDVLDSSNLERHLYLATQLLEIGIPLVLACNMWDLAQATGGLDIDPKRLGELLGCPVVPTVGPKGEGAEELLAAAVALANDKPAALAKQRHCAYGEEIEPHVAELETSLLAAGVASEHRRWFATKLLENDSVTIERLQRERGEDADGPIAQAKKLRHHIVHMRGDEPEILLADHRYGFISGLLAEVVRRTAVASRRDRSEKIDSVLMHPAWGLPIFAALMYLTFQITFTLGDIPMGWIESGIESLGSWVSHLWPKSADSWVRDMITTGIIPGVGGVLIFLPNIMLLFLAIAFLEGTGYMARAAFLTDRLMHRIGLHGRSFIPMLIGFGCTVPAILATRTIENKRDRLTTILILPLFSCGARYPIYALIIPIFFPVQLRGVAFLGIYLLGVTLALVFARIFRKTLLRGEAAEFVMELPPYRIPPLRGLLAHMWLRCYTYLKKAATIIFAFSMILWVLAAYPKVDFDAPNDDFYRENVVKLDPAPAIEKLVDTEMAFDATAERNWSDTSEYTAAETAWRNAQMATAKAHPWYSIAYRAQAIETEFQQAIDEHELCEWTVEPVVNLDGRVVEPGKPNPEYHLLATHRDDAISALKAENPPAFVTAEKYLALRTAHTTYFENIRVDMLQSSVRASYAGMLGSGLEPVVGTMGFDWKIATALVGATGGKELFVSQLGIVYAVGDAEGGGIDQLREKLSDNYSPLIGWCVMMFCLISMPCVATIAMTAREAGWRWAGFQLFYLTAAAWGLTTLVYQIGSALGG